MAETQSDAEAGSQSDKENQSQESQSQPLVFLNSSDESDQETGIYNIPFFFSKLPFTLFMAVT